MDLRVLGKTGNVASIKLPASSRSSVLPIHRPPEMHCFLLRTTDQLQKMNTRGQKSGTRTISNRNNSVGGLEHDTVHVSVQHSGTEPLRSSSCGRATQREPLLVGQLTRGGLAWEQLSTAKVHHVNLALTAYRPPFTAPAQSGLKTPHGPPQEQVKPPRASQSTCQLGQQSPLGQSTDTPHRCPLWAPHFPRVESPQSVPFADCVARISRRELTNVSQCSNHPPTMPSSTTIPSLGAAKPPPIVLDTLFLLALRGVYFLLARRYLLAHLSPALRDMSKPELGLPQPAAQQSASSSGGGRDRANSRVSIASIASGRSAGGFSTRGQRSASNVSAMSGLGVGVAGPGPSSSSLPPIDGDDQEELLLSPVNDTDHDIDDTGDDSSYPPSPGSRMLPDSGPSSPHVHVVALSPPRSRSPTPGAAPPIEMSLLGAKLREASSRPRQVLELAHPRGGASSAGGSVRRAKRAARGLSRVSRILFAVCFAESMNLLTLVVFHALGVLHSRGRAVNFSVSLHVLLGLILIVVPLVQCLLFTYRSSRGG